MHTLIPMQNYSTIFFDVIATSDILSTRTWNWTKKSIPLTQHFDRWARTLKWKIIYFVAPCDIECNCMWYFNILFIIIGQWARAIIRPRTIFIEMQYVKSHSARLPQTLEWCCACNATFTDASVSFSLSITIMNKFLFQIAGINTDSDCLFLIHIKCA